ncbi:MAG: helix-turn-helix domain-containing protein [Anaerolineae bacterium]|nr:helix-turn-helix domain-containing protein [Anaerolineae bacterium]NUQ03405.1 helix-turn-helix domain-containing protein [Anaerolineae bacterium]
MSDFSNISARMKSLRETEPAEERRAVDHDESFRIRARMVGLLLLDARRKAQRAQEDCARLARVSVAQYDRWEIGDEVPSLPQLEVLAFFLGVPVSHFWGMDTLEAKGENPVSAQNEYLALRDRMIGALLRSAREARALTLDDLSAESGLPADLIERYELGELPAPMHELTVLSNAVRKNITYFLESYSQLGELLAMREEWKHFTALPEEIRRFAANPLNIGFIEIAIMFSQMPADRLRKIGESALSIAP